MEVKIGVMHAPREITFESTEPPDEVEGAVRKALSEPESVLSLTDDRGRKVLVPSDRIGYVEIGSHAERRVGFTAE